MEYKGKALALLLLAACGPGKGKPFDVKDYRVGADLPLSVDASGLVYNKGKYEVNKFTVRGTAEGRYVDTTVEGDNTLYAMGEMKPIGKVSDNVIPGVKRIIIQCGKPSPTQLVRAKELEYSTEGCGRVIDLNGLENDISKVVALATKPKKK